MFQRSLLVAFLSSPRRGVFLSKAAKIHTGCTAYAETKCVTLNTGAKVPAFGLGTWFSKPEDVGPAVEMAIKAGYRHIDCAHLYGNELAIGEALQKCFKEGVVKREDIFITSKLWNKDHPREDVIPACEIDLRDLQLEYLDLFLVHWPFTLKKEAVLYEYTEEDKIGYDPERMARTWEAMEECVSKGMTKAIGISNFTITKTENLLKTAKIVPAVNQLECHPYFQQPKLKVYSDSKGIVLSAALPLGSPTRPDAIRSPTDREVLNDPVIGKIAQKYGVSPAQVCIAYTLSRGIMVTPKSIFENEILENYKATQLELDEEDLQHLRGLNGDDQNSRLMKGNVYWKKDMTYEKFWDVVEDEKYVI